MAKLEEFDAEYSPGWPGPQLHSKLLSVAAQAKVIDRNAAVEEDVYHLALPVEDSFVGQRKPDRVP